MSICILLYIVCDYLQSISCTSIFVHIQLSTIRMHSFSEFQQLSLNVKQHLASKVVHLKSSQFS